MEVDTAEQDHCPYLDGNHSSFSWRSAAEPVCTDMSLKLAVKALELLASGNTNARAEITALSEITGGSWKSNLMLLGVENVGVEKGCGGLNE